MEQVLLFQVQHEEAAEIVNLLAAMKVKCREIPVHAYRQTIGELAKGKQPSPVERGVPDTELHRGNGEAGDPQVREGTAAADYQGEAPNESLMLFCDVGEKHFNRILSQLRMRAVRIDYKAVLTPVNKEWNVLRLYAELAREKAEYERMR